MISASDVNTWHREPGSLRDWLVGLKSIVMRETFLTDS